jgi:tryptophanyl-tRNA synthetase
MFHPNKPRAITGDRPTGPLHLGHYVGSLKSRLALQDSHNLVVLVADLQALTDNAGNPQKISQNIPEVMKDYLAVGLDPQRTTFVLQSAVPELTELTVLLLNLATVAQLERNPTVKNEIVQRGFCRDLPAGFLCYPVSQAADIIGLGSGVVPVGDDQLPMIEIANVFIDRINARQPQGAKALDRCAALLSPTTRLPGILGGSKMSKSQGNAIDLSASADELKAAVHRMYTDPLHLKVSDPGQVEGNVVFSYLDAFDPDTVQVDELKRQYRAGGLGDMPLKKRLLSLMEAELAPIRERRLLLEGKEREMLEHLRVGSMKAREGAAQALSVVKRALGVFELPNTSG